MWSLGAVGKKDQLALVEGLVKDPDAAVAGDAAAALGRIATREGEAARAAAVLCPALAQERPYVRANAIEGLSIAGAGCEPADRAPAGGGSGKPAQARAAAGPGAAMIDVLARDPSEAARIAAADYLWRVVAKGGDKPDAASVRALARCTGEERDAAVAARCARPLVVSSPPTHPDPPYPRPSR